MDYHQLKAATQRLGVASVAKHCQLDRDTLDKHLANDRRNPRQRTLEEWQKGVKGATEEVKQLLKDVLKIINK